MTKKLTKHMVAFPLPLDDLCKKKAVLLYTSQLYMCVGFCVCVRPESGANTSFC